MKELSQDGTGLINYQMSGTDSMGRGNYGKKEMAVHWVDLE